MKTTIKFLGILLALAMVGCGQKATNTDETNVKKPKKVLSVADLVVQHLINTAPDTLNHEWLAHLKKMRAIDQQIRQVANYKDEEPVEEKSSQANMVGAGGSVSAPAGSYVYMQSCCRCGPKCCGCTQYLISTTDVTSLTLSGTMDSTAEPKKAESADDGSARIFTFNVADGPYLLNVNYTDNGAATTISVPVTVENNKVSIRQ